MNTTQAQTSLKSIYSEANSLTPQSLVTLFEIDYTDLATDQGLSVGSDGGIFRFHNNVKLLQTNILFQGKNFIAAPIKAEGFEVSSRGTLPSPHLSMTVDETGIDFFALFKDRLKSLADLVGAKVTRIRTFAKYLDIRNWSPDQIPDWIAPDENAEFPRDVYYIDRKSNENKFTIEFELASMLDVENIVLPSRRVLAKRCSFDYRSEGCLYEYSNLKNDEIHGETATLPEFAPPTATDRDELISNIINVRMKTPEPYNADKLGLYVKGSVVYLTKNNINYYFVCKVNNPTKSPPDSNEWCRDACSKSVKGCRLRFGTEGAMGVGNSGLVKGNLNFGGFLGADRIS